MQYRQAKLAWLVVPIGFRVVLQHIGEYITRSAWFKLFNAATPAENEWTVDLDKADGLYAAFLGETIYTNEL
ncbi:hypothetical protein H2198_001453 [Neophaeococcomyces mojaviensis]|uniref:Uncharacterized protein n=1 Tax=Neophaeococcomyces mojaviensis TaxID=3383035 RepID=A0ACC3AH00_9EURO|nr:hypothetical protein H2198_001453 [Knufia sp. JES_112]